MTWLADIYVWLKALHVIAVIAWMAGMLYLPRLFVYHARAEPGSESSEMLKVMERRLLRFIITPAMVASFLLGGLLLAVPGLIDWGSAWIWLKLGFAIVVAGLRDVFARWQRAFAADDNRRGEAFYRRMNEVPTVLMIAIVVLAVVKPF